MAAISCSSRVLSDNGQKTLGMRHTVFTETENMALTVQLGPRSPGTSVLPCPP